MNNYDIIFTRSARKEIESFDNKTIQKILPKIESLAKMPWPVNCLKLQGEENLWRIRIADYRVIYSIYDNKHIVDIIAVPHRNEAYK